MNLLLDLLCNEVVFLNDQTVKIRTEYELCWFFTSNLLRTSVRQIAHKPFIAPRLSFRQVFIDVYKFTRLLNLVYKNHSSSIRWLIRKPCARMK